MAVTLMQEDGSGVYGANSYPALATVTAYWDNQPHRAEAAAWAAADSETKLGACVEGSAYVDATFGQFFRGQRMGYVQGLLWPRVNAFDESGYPLPDVPRELIEAVCELAGRAVSETLSEDKAVQGGVKRIRRKVGSIEQETEYLGSNGVEKKFGIVAGLLAPILNGGQPGAASGRWVWA